MNRSKSKSKQPVKKAETYREEERAVIKNVLLNSPLFQSIPEKETENVAASIERGIYNATIDECKSRNIATYWEAGFISRYSAIGYRVLSNLDPESSINQPYSDDQRSYLIRRVYNWASHNNEKEKIDPLSLALLQSEDLNPHINVTHRRMLELRAKQQIDKKTSSIYKCNDCGESKTIYYDLQIARSDEGSTLSIECTVCGNHWYKRTG